jgi:hypothetical protein
MHTIERSNTTINQTQNGTTPWSTSTATAGIERYDAMVNGMTPWSTTATAHGHHFQRNQFWASLFKVLELIL